MTEKIPNDLNESQRRAIDHEGRALLIVAGPGTGKTHTLTHRIARYSTHLKDHQKILAITFTNKASLMMKERLKERLGSLEKITVCTFHGFCLQVLRTH